MRMCVSVRNEDFHHGMERVHPVEPECVVRRNPKPPPHVPVRLVHSFHAMTKTIKSEASDPDRGFGRAFTVNRHCTAPRKHKCVISYVRSSYLHGEPVRLPVG